MLFRNIEDFEDDLIGEKNKINLKGIDDTKFNIIIDQTNQSGILTGINAQGELNFPTCKTIKLPIGSTAEIQGRAGIKLSCGDVDGQPYRKILCKDGDKLTNCCGTEVCSNDGGCYQIQYDKKTHEFNCVDGTPSKLNNLFACDSNNGCIAATNTANAMSLDTCVNLCKKYKKCDNKNLVTIHSTTNSNEYYDFDTQFPNNPCNLKDTTVDIRGYTCDLPSTTCKKSLQKVKKINTCDLIKHKNGCHDLDGKLKTSGARDSGFCTLGSLKAPAGVEIQTYSPPPWNCIPSTWKDMCSTKGCRPFNGASPNDVHNTFESLGSDGINLGIDDLYMKMCSAKFRLTDKNKHACD